MSKDGSFCTTGKTNVTVVQTNAITKILPPWILLKFFPLEEKVKE